MLRWFAAQMSKSTLSLGLNDFIPAIDPAPRFRVALSDSHGVKIHFDPSRHAIYKFADSHVARDGQGEDLFQSWDDLSQELRLLVFNHIHAVLSALKEAGYELPKELLRALREVVRAGHGSGFFEAHIKPLILPLKLVPKSLHPIESIAC